MSAVMPAADTPSVFSSSTVPSRVLRVLPQMATFTPSRASAKADTLPSPRLPPVTIATLP